MDFIYANENTEEYKLDRMKKVVRLKGSYDTIINDMVENKEETSNILLYSDNARIFNQHYPCRVDIVQNAPKTAIVNSGLIFTKNWPFTKLFNYHLLRMKEEGILDRLLLPYINKIQKSCPGDRKIRSAIKDPTPIESEKILFLYVILSMGFSISLILLLFEFIYQLFHKKKDALIPETCTDDRICNESEFELKFDLKNETHNVVIK